MLASLWIVASLRGSFEKFVGGKDSRARVCFRSELLKLETDGCKSVERVGGDWKLPADRVERSAQTRTFAWKNRLIYVASVYGAGKQLSRGEEVVVVSREKIIVEFQ